MCVRGICGGDRMCVLNCPKRVLWSLIRTSQSGFNTGAAHISWGQVRRSVLNRISVYTHEYSKI